MKNHLGVVVGIVMVASALVIYYQTNSNIDLGGIVGTCTEPECEMPAKNCGETFSECNGTCPGEEKCGLATVGLACECKLDCSDKTSETEGSVTRIGDPKSNEDDALGSAKRKARDHCKVIIKKIPTPPKCPDGCDDLGIGDPIPSYSREDCKLYSGKWTCVVDFQCQLVRDCGEKKPVTQI